MWSTPLITHWDHRCLPLESSKDRQWSWLRWGDTTMGRSSLGFLLPRTAGSCSFYLETKCLILRVWECGQSEPRLDLQVGSSWLPISFVQGGHGQPRVINPD